MTVSQTKLPLTLRFVAAGCALLRLLAVSACDLEHFLLLGHHGSSEGHEHSPAAAHQHGSDSPQPSHGHDEARHSHDAEDDSHGSHEHGSNENSCCSTLKASVPSAKPFVFLKPVFHPIPFLSVRRETDETTCSPSQGFEYRQAKPPDWVFTPEVCLGPAFRSRAPPVFL